MYDSISLPSLDLVPLHLALNLDIDPRAERPSRVRTELSPKSIKLANLASKSVKEDVLLRLPVRLGVISMPLDSSG